MLVLLLSPVPMVRGFGLLLVVGVVVAFLCALTAGSAALVLADAARRSADVLRRAARATRSRARARALARRRLAGRARAAAGQPAQSLLSRVALVEAVRRPGRVLVRGAGAGGARLGAGYADARADRHHQARPAEPRIAAEPERARAATGVGGEIDLMVARRTLTKPATIEWMSSYESAVLKRFGYSATRGCGQGAAVPGVLAAGPVRGQRPPALRHRARRRDAHEAHAGEVNGLLDAIPPYFSQDVITPDRRVATLAFGIRLMSLAEQQRVIEAMRSSLHPPRASARSSSACRCWRPSRVRRWPRRGGAWRRCWSAWRRSRSCC